VQSTGVAHIQQGLGAVQSTGQKLYHPYHLALLAEAYGQAGQPEAGLTCLWFTEGFETPDLQEARR
jgi:predicted ATPase